MSIDKISMNLKSIQSITQPEKSEAPKQPGQSKAPDFGEMFADAIKEVDSLQKEADNKITGMVLGQGVTTHDAMIALEKADVAFQLMNQVRSKIVQAYQEVIRTQI